MTPFPPKRIEPNRTPLANFIRQNPERDHTNKTKQKSARQPPANPPQNAPSGS